MGAGIPAPVEVSEGSASWSEEARFPRGTARNRGGSSGEIAFAEEKGRDRRKESSELRRSVGSPARRPSSRLIVSTDCIGKPNPPLCFASRLQGYLESPRFRPGFRRPTRLLGAHCQLVHNAYGGLERSARLRRGNLMRGILIRPRPALVGEEKDPRRPLRGRTGGGGRPRTIFELARHRCGHPLPGGWEFAKG